MFIISINIVDNMKKNKKKILVIEKKNKKSAIIFQATICMRLAYHFFTDSVFDVAYFRK